MRPLGAADLPLVVGVHLSAFPDSALSRLGPEVVRRNYLSLHTGPHELLALGAFLGTSLLGFCYGGVLRGELSYFLLTNRWFLIRHVLTHPWLVNNPIVRDRLKLGLRLLRTPERMTDRPEEISDPSLRYFGIQAIAVDRQTQGSGVGKILMICAEDIARQRGFKRMLLTVHPDNVQAISFYEAIGWTKHYVDGKWSQVMRKDFAEPATGVDTARPN